VRIRSSRRSWCWPFFQTPDSIPYRNEEDLVIVLLHEELACLLTGHIVVDKIRHCRGHALAPIGVANALLVRGPIVELDPYAHRMDP